MGALVSCNNNDLLELALPEQGRPTGSHAAKLPDPQMQHFHAVKYRHSARVPQVHVSAVEQGDDVVFCVRDNSIGIDMQYASRIFGMFQRLHGTGHEESGIGLARCKAIVESRGGRIWVESQPGSGSSLYFALPKLRSEPNPVPPASTITVRV